MAHPVCGYRAWTWIDGLPDRKWGGGVYALYQGARLVYVEQTRNLRTRIMVHRRRFRFDGVKVADVGSRAERISLERRLLYRLRPPMNCVLPGTRGELLLR